MIQQGYYRHYKGGVYQVINVGKHTETEEELVVYRDIKGQMWIRPVSMWNEKVDGVTRFEYFEDQRNGRFHFMILKRQYMINKSN